MERLQQELLTWKPTLAINNGDISYARCAHAHACSMRCGRASPTFNASSMLMEAQLQDTFGQRLAGLLLRSAILPFGRGWSHTSRLFGTPAS